MRPEILRALFDPMLHAKRNAIAAMRPYIEARASTLPPWWAWTVWLAFGITVQRIENA